MNIKQYLNTPVAIVIGAIVIASAVSVHWALERQRRSCDSLLRSVHGDPMVASMLVDRYLYGDTNGNLLAIVQAAERVSGASAQRCFD